MDPEGFSDGRLLQHLKESRSRFQTLMQRLIAKYNQPFEDDPLVQMATLTYETPQGLRVWGGKLVKKRNTEQAQDPSVKMLTRLNGHDPDGSECLQPCTQALGEDSEISSADTSAEEEDPLSCTLKPAVPGSPLKDDLRRKYLSQVDILLQDAQCLQAIKLFLFSEYLGTSAASGSSLSGDSSALGPQTARAAPALNCTDEEIASTTFPGEVSPHLRGREEREAAGLSFTAVLSQSFSLHSRDPTCHSGQSASHQDIPHRHAHRLPDKDSFSNDSLENTEKRGRNDTLTTWVPSPVTPAPGCQDNVSAESFGGPEVSASSSRNWGPSNPCPADTTIIPRNDSCSLLGTSSNNLSNQSLEVDDICNVTVSDLYEGMMHSMSRLLSIKPSCIISTKTYINWNSNFSRRRSRKSGVHMNRTYCHRSKPSRRSKGPCSEPGTEARVLRDCKNLPHIAPPQSDLKLERGSLKGDKLQVHKFSPAWKELQVTPQKYLDVNTMYYLERENRIKTLQWLISPVKMVPRPRMLPSQTGKCYREIEMKFDKLYQECCLSSGKQPCLTGPAESWAVDVYRVGSRSPGSLQGIKTCRLSLSFSRGKAKRSSEAFEDLSETSAKVRRCLPRSDPASSLSEDSASQSPGCSQLMSGLLHQGYNSGPTRKAWSPGTAVSALWTGSQGYSKSRYDEIKKEFNKLYQKYCLMSPQRVRGSSMKAAAVISSRAEDLRKSNPDPRFQSAPQMAISPD